VDRKTSQTLWAAWLRGSSPVLFGCDAGSSARASAMTFWSVSQEGALEVRASKPTTSRTSSPLERRCGVSTVADCRNAEVLHSCRRFDLANDRLDPLTAWTEASLMNRSSRGGGRGSLPLESARLKRSEAALGLPGWSVGGIQAIVNLGRPSKARPRRAQAHGQVENPLSFEDALGRGTSLTMPRACRSRKRRRQVLALKVRQTG